MKDNCEINFSIPFKTRIQLYRIWIEKGWWTSSEATCVFLKYAPSVADDYRSFDQITSTRLGSYVSQLVANAIITRSLKLVIDGGPDRLSCQEWMEWANNYPLIQLDPDLVELIAKVSKKGLKNPIEKRTKKPGSINFAL